MSDQEKGNGNGNGAKERLKEEFASLPLDKKLASLFELEMVALGESVSYVVNSSGEIFDKVAQVVNDFSERVQSEFKKGTQQAEATTSDSAESSSTEEGPEKPKGQKKQKDSGGE